MLAILINPLAVNQSAQTNAAEGITSGISGLGSSVVNLTEPILLGVYFFVIIALIAIVFKAASNLGGDIKMRRRAAVERGSDTGLDMIKNKLG